MIVEIDENIFFSDDEEILKDLAFIVREEMLLDKHFWNVENIQENLDLIKETEWYLDYLSTMDQQGFEEVLDAIISKSAYITKMHTKYLTSIKIGESGSQISLRDAKVLLHERSKVIVENATNDWKFIKGLIEKYKNHKTKKTVFKLLHKALNNNWIEPEHAGGKTGIQTRIIDLLDRYGDAYRLKLATLFDSDCTSPKKELKKEVKKLLGFLKSEHSEKVDDRFNPNKYVIIWHMLFKREIENYLPLVVIEEHSPEEKTICATLKKLKPEELDYIDMEEQFKNLNVKRGFPELFLDKKWRKNLLEERCSHHLEQIETPNNILEEISEMEVILLKLVKII